MMISFQSENRASQGHTKLSSDKVLIRFEWNLLDDRKRREGVWGPEKMTDFHDKIQTTTNASTDALSTTRYQVVVYLYIWE